jgi:hypothetical protein
MLWLSGVALVGRLQLTGTVGAQFGTGTDHPAKSW